MPSIHEISQGTLITENKCHVLFGNIHSNIDLLKSEFTHVKWSRIKQTHSDVVIKATSLLDQSKTEADAHWTNETGLGLVIATADCLPICVYSKSIGKIAAIHAGWKGIANQITLKCIESEFPNSCRKDLKIFIGPHILQESFEIETDVFNILKTSDPDLKFYFDEKSKKYYVDLADSLAEQLKKLDVQHDHIYFLDKDTKTNLRYHSYRRDKEKSGRNLTAIWLDS